MIGASQMIDDRLYDYAGETFLEILDSGSRKQDDALGRICAYITNQYECYNRKYHNCHHIVDVVDKLEQYIFEHPDCKHQHEMRMALLLHDVIYDVPCFGGMTNEMKSAAIFDKVVVKMFPELRDKIDCHLVSDLILSTQYGTEFEARKVLS
jgi:predicted metal-dependent HD superfamily phosphohydrolase